jgi:Dyp-type peroxidase family
LLLPFRTWLTILTGASYVDCPDYDPGYDPKNGHGSNEFTFATPRGCALAAHIRKTNPRIVSEVSSYRRIIRNGIPYGPEHDNDEDTERGLLFACYQSSIENGFQQIQASWVNNVDFPNDEEDNRAGYDPFIGQPGKDEQLQTTIFDGTNKPVDSKLFEKLPKLITMKGGEYFFVPSISALLVELGSA